MERPVVILEGVVYAFDGADEAVCMTETVTTESKEATEKGLLELDWYTGGKDHLMDTICRTRYYTSTTRNYVRREPQRRILLVPRKEGALQSLLLLKRMNRDCACQILMKRICSGTSSNVIEASFAREELHDFVRKTNVKLEFDIAKGTAKTSRGIRAQVARWDCPSDYLLMKNSPDLIPLGEKVICGGFSFVWVTGKNHVSFLNVGSMW